MSAIDPDLLPEQGYFCPTHEAAITKQRALVDAKLAVKEAETEPVLTADVFARFVLVIQGFFRQCYKKTIAKLTDLKLKRALGDDVFSAMQVYGFTSGSFVVKFRSKEKADLIHDTNFQRSFTLAEKLLNPCNNIDSVIQHLRENRGHFVVAYSRLLNFLIEHEGDLKVRLSTPTQRDEGNFFELSCQTATNIKNALAKEPEIDIESITIRGKFSVIRVNEGQWQIETDEGESKSGIVQPGSDFILQGLTTSTVSYDLECVEIILTDALGQERSELQLFNCSVAKLQEDFDS